MIGLFEKVRVKPGAVWMYLVHITIVFVAYFVAGKLGQATINIRSGNLGPVWPAYGVALAAVLLYGYRVWVAIVAAAFLVAFLSPVPLVTAVGQAVGATFAALSGAFLLRRIDFRASLSRLRDALGLIVFGALVSAMVSASIGVSVLYATHVQAYSGIGPAWVIYWLGDGTGALLVTPLVLAVHTLLRIRPAIRIAEFAVLLLLLTVACLIVFGDLPLIPVKLHILAFAVLPLIVWGALRFGMLGATLSTLLVATIATAETAFGFGPFAQNTSFINAVLLDVFFAVLSVSGMTLAAGIAEREQAEKEREQLVRKQAAIEARLRLATIVESSDDAIIGTDMDGMIVDWNQGAERLYGYPASEVIGKSLSLLIPPDLREDFPEIVAKLRHGHAISLNETVRQKKDGTRVEVSLTMSSIRDTEARFVGASVIGRNISERKRQEALLRESEERFRLAAQAGKMFAYEWDAATDVIVRSPESAQILGIEEAALTTGQQILTHVHTDDRERLVAAVAALSPEKPHLQISYRIVRPDGTVIWVERNSRAHFDEQGRMLRIIGMVADITGHKRAEEALRVSEERFRLAALAGKMYAYEWDVATDRVTRSAEHVDVLGFSDQGEQLTRQQLVATVHPDDRALFIGSVAQVTPENPTTHTSYRMLRPDGSVVWLEKSARSFFDEQGRMLRVIGMVADITEHKRVEDALRESEDKLRLLLDSTAEAIYGMDLEGRCTFCNPACLRILGYECVDELLGKNMHDLIHHTRADGTFFPVEQCRIFGAFRAGEGAHVDDEVLWRRNGTSFPAEYWSYPQCRGQEIVGAVVAFIDITQRKLSEAALEGVSRKLIEVQERERTRIARELHDDIGQRLALVVNELERLQGGFPDLPVEARSRVAELSRQTSQISNDVQSLSHELHSAKLEYLGIVAAMRGFCKDFSEQQKVEIDFKSDNLPNPPSPDISLCLLRVLQEALHNSAKHSGVRHFEVRLRGTGDELHLTVSDSGVGFDREAAKEGPGLGLVSMEERLKLVDGTFSIESQLKSGTTIHARVRLGSADDSMRAVG